MSLTIELAGRDDQPCSCCGGTTTHLTRFVHSGDDTRAVYYAAFSDKHKNRMVSVIVGLGDWSDGSKEEDRVAFAVRIRSADDQYQVMVIDTADTQWHDATFLGRMLTRQEARKHPWLKEVFHITDHIVEEDEDVKRYLDG